MTDKLLALLWLLLPLWLLLLGAVWSGNCCCCCRY